MRVAALRWVPCPCRLPEFPYEVMRIDDWPGTGAKRLWIDHTPYMLGSRDVEFAYKSDDERRKRLKDLGVSFSGKLD